MELATEKQEILDKAVLETHENGHKMFHMKHLGLFSLIQISPDKS